MSDIAVMSSKGQIVVPKSLRDELGIDAGTTFAVFGQDDALIFKKINMPNAKEAFDKLSKWGQKLAKEKGWKEKDIMKKIHQGRGIADA